MNKTTEKLIELRSKIDKFSDKVLPLFSVNNWSYWSGEVTKQDIELTCNLLINEALKQARKNQTCIGVSTGRLSVRTVVYEVGNEKRYRAFLELIPESFEV